MNRNDSGFEFNTPVMHNGVPIGSIRQCATDDDSKLYDSKLYDAWLGFLGAIRVATGVSRNEAISALVRAHMS